MIFAVVAAAAATTSVGGGKACEVPRKGRIGKPVRVRHRARCGDRKVAGQARKRSHWTLEVREGGRSMLTRKSEDRPRKDVSRERPNSGSLT
jgi:hypothetical protein